MLRKIVIQRTAFRDTAVTRPVSQHVPRSPRLNARSDWLTVPIAENELCIGLLREVRHAGSDCAPTLIAPSRFIDDTCLTWYQTGNPY
jgi:hypothetical protein